MTEVIKITDPDGTVVVKMAPGGILGIGGAAVWGGISGTLSSQTDLQTALDAKVPVTRTVNSKALTGNITITKSDVLLANVDNTSDSTKNAATATLTNKTLTSPVINSPTGIVKADVGLGSVDNTSDANKPVSTAQATAIALKATDTLVVHLAGAETVTGIKTYSVSPIVPTPTTGTQAAHKNYVDGAISGLTKASVGLSNVDNTSDATKPVSTATQTALNLKADFDYIIDPLTSQIDASLMPNISAGTITTGTLSVDRLGGNVACIVVKDPTTGWPTRPSLNAAIRYIWVGAAPAPPLDSTHALSNDFWWEDAG